MLPLIYRPNTDPKLLNQFEMFCLSLQAVDGIHQGGQLGQDLVQGVNIDLFQLCGDFRQILHHAVQLGLIQCVQTSVWTVSARSFTRLQASITLT